MDKIRQTVYNETDKLRDLIYREKNGLSKQIEEKAAEVREEIASENAKLREEMNLEHSKLKTKLEAIEKKLDEEVSVLKSDLDAIQKTNDRRDESIAELGRKLYQVDINKEQTKFYFKISDFEDLIDVTGAKVTRRISEFFQCRGMALGKDSLLEEMLLYYNLL